MCRIADGVALLLALALAGTTFADISVITAPPSLEPSRSVTAEATGDPGSSVSTNAGGFWDESVMASGSTPAGVITSNAAQVSTIPNTVGASISGSGGAGVTITSTGFAPYTYRADSTFDVFFEVTQERVYEFRGDVSWSGTLPEFNSGFTTVVFRDDTNNMSIHFAEADEMNPGGSWDIFPTLSPGIVYQLKVRAHMSGESGVVGNFLALNNYSFDLYPVVPEPAALNVLATGLLAGVLRSVRRFRR